MEYISGSGAPSINTVANPGDIYTDINTGNRYICRETISQSTNYISDVRTEYRWKRYPHFSFDEILGILVEIDAIPALTINDSFLSVDENILIV